jgi:hypothetical protein
VVGLVVRAVVLVPVMLLCTVFRSTDMILDKLFILETSFVNEGIRYQHHRLKVNLHRRTHHDVTPRRPAPPAAALAEWGLCLT